ncbi:MAG: DinB family protein [Rubrivivax sp.]|nr:DinB family protein [Rubrivivax sp.]
MNAPRDPNPMQLVDTLRIQAHANRLINQRLHRAMEALPAEDFAAPRTGFFPSLAGTLNHILAVDRYYVAALEGDPEADRQWHAFVPATTLPELARRQAEVDLRLIAAAAGDPDRVVAMPRGGGRVQRDRAAAVLMHLFMHQHHHRGQAHAMLSGTALKPPQLDEFMMPSEAHLRADDMALAGWAEADVYGLPP